MNVGLFLFILIVVTGMFFAALFGARRVQRFEDELERVFWERERGERLEADWGFDEWGFDVVDRLPETEAK